MCEVDRREPDEVDRIELEILNQILKMVDRLSDQQREILEGIVDLKRQATGTTEV